MSFEVVCADVIEWAGGYDGPPFHACLCDPPYELKFMNRSWDASGISFQPETWAALAQHLHPGAFVFAFASSRGWHRLAVAIEDSGMIIQPSIFGWCTGSAFPKATRIDTQIDKRAGKLEEREVITRPIAYSDSDCWGTPNKNVGPKGSDVCYGEYEDRPPGGMKVDTAPATDLARAWVGHRYGGQVLKNALEPIICAQKPWVGKRLDCIVDTGAGSLWIDGGRISTDEIKPLESEFNAGYWQPSGGHGKRWSGDGTAHPRGRWPSNFVLTHDAPETCPDCDGDGCDKCDGEGVVGGCQRAGVRKVSGDKRQGGGSGGIWSGESNVPVSHGYDGETVADYRCTESCPILRLNKSMVDNSVFPQYNRGKQEVNQCCESASIAVVNLMLDHLMSSGDLGDSVAESVDMPASANVEKLTHGDNKTNATGAGTDIGGSQETASCITSLNTDGFGKCQTELSQKAMISTTLTEIDRITICPICNSYLQLSIMLCTNDGEKIIELSKTEQKQGVVRDAENTNRSQVILSVQRGHIMVIVKIAKENTNGSGERKTLAITRNICESGASVSRFFHQSDWSYEVAERLALADPVRYQAKSSRRERDAGLDGLPAVARQNALRNQVCENCGKSMLDGRRDGPCCDNPQYKAGQVRQSRNPHPTVKPIALNIWLCRLLAPPQEYAPRRLLIPFAGSGSEVIAAILSGCWEEIIGIDNNAEYCQIAEARVRWWQGWSERANATEPKGILKAAKKGQPEPDKEQLELM